VRSLIARESAGVFLLAAALGAHAPHDRVEAVLSRLVDAGVLELRRLPSGGALYALRRSRGDALPADEA
jgi:hypothetical protein